MFNGEELVFFKELPIFCGMSTDDIRAALGCVGAFLRDYKKDSFVILREEKIKCVGVVLKGRIEMVREDMWGGRTVLITVGETELFGETFACGTDLTASVSFVAQEDTRVLFMPFDRVMHSCPSACAHHQSLLLNMVVLIAKKNAAFITKLDIMSKKTIREKIQAYLLAHTNYDSRKYFTIPLGRVQLAEYLSVDRSALTRELNHMRDEGYIDFDKNTFRILKKF